MSGLFEGGMIELSSKTRARQKTSAGVGGHGWLWNSAWRWIETGEAFCGFGSKEGRVVWTEAAWGWVQTVTGN